MRIGDNYQTYEDVQKAIRDAGLESSNLIFGIDFTKSNVFTGEKTFQGRCLHDVGVKNPYMEVIEILGETLEPFDDDNVIPSFGFGDTFTTDKKVFPFFPDKHPVGFKEVLSRYKYITPSISFAGPTNFAPLIKEAIKIVKEKKSYHILVIVTDGQVNNVKDTVAEICEAAKYPISIVTVGVGDGPWDEMERFDDRLPKRAFDNFQFVDFMKVKKKNPTFLGPSFALYALMEIPEQFKLIHKLGLLG